eukprot:CAMPEP_0113594216 /NCGR_PEP_ID=MMETSP0015_2-20120614/38935_1 /TAXON_ID=2838 /ORGANISM="Odontella" /LENGTH=277 /DNA_ID=CAMNT_0000501151 /DNA_START=305 /DNA_END=1137 /DNA_ORIENTATION=+ /assembly_acc=CAM_ASM_000160
MSTLLSAARLLSVLLLLRPNHRCHALSLLSDRGNRFDSSSANRPRGAPKTTAAAAHADRRNVARDIIAGGAGIFCTSAALAFSPAPSFAMYENAPAVPEESQQIQLPSGGKNAPAIPEESQQIQLPSGVMYVDLRPGSGDVVEEGKRVNVQWVLKRSNGYFVDSSSNNDGVPFIFTVGDPKGAMAGVDEGIRGMRVGGIRRIIVPPNLDRGGGRREAGTYTRGVRSQAEDEEGHVAAEGYTRRVHRGGCQGDESSIASHTAGMCNSRSPLIRGIPFK